MGIENLGNMSGNMSNGRCFTLYELLWIY